MTTPRIRYARPVMPRTHRTMKKWYVTKNIDTANAAGRNQNVGLPNCAR
jgi:hypothetical protein